MLNAQSNYGLTVLKFAIFTLFLERFTFKIVPKLNVTIHEKGHSTKIVAKCEG